MAVVPDGRPSITGYRVRERFDGWTLLELDLVTGRTHQIRVHLDAIGHPVAGDPVYGTGTSRRGPDGLDRLFLHAWRLELASPTDGHLIRADRAASARARRGARGHARGGVTPMTVRGPDRDGRNLDPYAAIDVSQDPGGPTSRSRGRRGDAWPSSRGRPASARTRSSMPCVAARSKPATAAIATTSSR